MQNQDFSSYFFILNFVKTAVFTNNFTYLFYKVYASSEAVKFFKGQQ